MGNTFEKQLRESLAYVEIKRGAARPTRLDEILQRRMDDFLSRRLSAIATVDSAGFKLESLE